MIALIALLLLTHLIHVSSGPAGIVAWIQPPHIAAGIGYVHHHVITWWETRL